MTETEAVYKLEHPEEAGDPPCTVEPDGEPLPECETGSVEKMLEAAIRWNANLEPRVAEGILGSHVYNPMGQERVPKVIASQTQLLRNILAKMREAEEPLHDAEDNVTIVRSEKQHMRCPYCDDVISAEVILTY